MSGFGSGGLFGSGAVEKKTTTTSQETTTAQDQRVQVEGDVGSGFTGPGATVAGQAAIQTGPYSPVNQSIYAPQTGMSGADVKAILDRNAAASLEQSKQISQLAVAQQNAIGQIAGSSVNAMAAQKTGEPISLSRYTPYIIVAAIVLAVVWMGGRRR